MKRLLDRKYWPFLLFFLALTLLIIILRPLLLARKTTRSGASPQLPSENCPVSVVLVLDASESILKGNHLQAIKRAVGNFLDDLKVHQESLGPQEEDRFAIVTFAHEAEQIFPQQGLSQVNETTIAAAKEEVANHLTPQQQFLGTATNGPHALRKAINDLLADNTNDHRPGGKGREVVVFLSDGMFNRPDCAHYAAETGGLPTPTPLPIPPEVVNPDYYCAADLFYREAERMKENGRIIAYLIAVNPGSEIIWGGGQIWNPLKIAIEKTSGAYIKAKNWASDLEEIFDRIVNHTIDCFTPPLPSISPTPTPPPPSPQCDALSLALDVSGSMTSYDWRCFSRLESIKQGLEESIRLTTTTTGEDFPLTQIIRFSSFATSVTFQSKEAVLDYLGRLQAFGGTNLYSAVQKMNLWINDHPQSNALLITDANINMGEDPRPLINDKMYFLVFNAHPHTLELLVPTDENNHPRFPQNCYVATDMKEIRAVTDALYHKACGGRAVNLERIGLVPCHQYLEKRVLPLAEAESPLDQISRCQSAATVYVDEELPSECQQEEGTAQCPFTSLRTALASLTNQPASSLKTLILRPGSYQAPSNLITLSNLVIRGEEPGAASNTKVVGKWQVRGDNVVFKDLHLQGKIGWADNGASVLELGQTFHRAEPSSYLVQNCILSQSAAPTTPIAFNLSPFLIWRGRYTDLKLINNTLIFKERAIVLENNEGLHTTNQLINNIFFPLEPQEETLLVQISGRPQNKFEKTIVGFNYIYDPFQVHPQLVDYDKVLVARSKGRSITGAIFLGLRPQNLQIPEGMSRWEYFIKNFSSFEYLVEENAATVDKGYPYSTDLYTYQSYFLDEPQAGTAANLRINAGAYGNTPQAAVKGVVRLPTPTAVPTSFVGLLPPQLIAGPQPGETISSRPFTVSVKDVSPAGSNYPHDAVFTIWQKQPGGGYVKIKTSYWLSDVLTAPGETYSYEWPALPDGQYQWRVNLRDTQGNYLTNPLIVPFQVTSPTPTPTPTPAPLLPPQPLSGPQENEVISNHDSFTVSIKDISPPGSNYPHDAVFTIWQKQENGEYVKIRTSYWLEDVLAAFGDTYSYEWSALPAGQYQWRVNLRDTQGNYLTNPLIVSFKVE